MIEKLEKLKLEIQRAEEGRKERIRLHLSKIARDAVYKELDIEFTDKEMDLILANRGF